MRRRGLGQWLAAGATLALFGCSLLVETSELDQGCGAGQKFCGGRCVGIEDPTYGCQPDICAPCEVNNAVPVCLDGACAVGACLLGFGCAECKTNLLVDRAHCGDCENPCAAGQRCDRGVCKSE